MNKLVLKNPVLKFKLGKIIKAQFENMLRKHKYDVMAAIAGANAFNPFGTAILSYVVPKATLKAFKKDLPSTTSYPDGAYFEEKGPDGQVKKGRWQGGKKVYLTVTPTRTNLQAKTSKNITTTNLYSPKKPYFQSKYSNRANEIGVDKIKEWLKKIGTKVDGIWGENTERAYLAWLNRNGRGFKPGVYNDTEAQTLLTTPATSTVPVTNADITEITGTTPTYSTTSTPQFNIIGDSGTTYSNEHVRDLFENVLLRTPTYKYATTFAKKGAKLVSRNPVEKFLQGRNLPTAPKAEDRYRNGRRTWNMPQYKEVSSASNIFGDPFASRIAMEINNNNDTTFYETPGRWLPVKFKTRTASKKNLNFKTLSQYNGLPIQETKTIVISPEYETLKRRFNTAWSLAK